MSPFCAVCTRPCATYVREPLGRNDALVIVCSRCATEAVVPKDPIAAKRGPAIDVSTMDRAEWIRLHRADLVSRGLCMFGEKHARPLDGYKACESCRTRDKGRKQFRRAA